MATNYPSTLDTDNSLLLAKDLAISTLSSALTAAATTISLADATSFPAAGGIIKIDNELIKYSGKTGNDLTGATRGYSGTTAISHSSGAEARLVVASDYHNNLKDAVIALETRLGANGTPASIDGVKLRAGVQEEGRAGIVFTAAAADDYGGHIHPYRSQMTNTPSAVTLSDVVETSEGNVKSGYPVADLITVYGFRFLILANTSGNAFSQNKKYVTVGN